jgi:hypothetical protein
MNWNAIQCLVTKGSRRNTYLITSYSTPPLASMNTNSLINCISSLLISSISLASHHFLFHSPFVINGQKDYSLSSCWMALEIFESYLHGINFLHCQLIQESVIHIQHTFSMILDLLMMIKKYDNMEWYIWLIDIK